MGWSVGYDSNWHRDVGYGVPALCDWPGCDREIDRGLGYICGDGPYGGETGCGLFFCMEHGGGSTECFHPFKDDASYWPSTDVPEWVNHELTDESWQQWRDANPDEVQRLSALGTPVEDKR